MTSGMTMGRLEKLAGSYNATIDEGSDIEIVANDGMVFDEVGVHVIVIAWDEQVRSDGRPATRRDGIKAAIEQLLEAGPAVPCTDEECDFCEGATL